MRGPFGPYESSLLARACVKAALALQNATNQSTKQLQIIRVIKGLYRDNGKMETTIL